MILRHITKNKLIIKDMIKQKIVLIILVFSFYNLCGQNKTNISGFVYDSASGEVLIGATIYELHSKQGTYSNEYGFYSLTFPVSDSIEISVSFIGYQPIKKTISKNHEKQINFHLTQGVNLNEITISASQEKDIIKRNETGVVHLQMKEIKTLPNLFGEVDIIKAFQLTPGVQSGGEGKSELYIRGGSPDQNLILLDDVPLYYVAHFGGFFSVFNADAINDVKLIKSGFPAHYGSRLSSVLDIRMKEGNMQKLCVQGSLGLLTSKLSIEAPIIKNKLSFIVSARKNTLPILKIMGTGIGYNFYDINGKINYRLSDRNKFFLSYYMGDDVVSIKNKTPNIENINSVKWGNLLGSFRWNHVFNDKLFCNLTISNTYYHYKTTFENSQKTDSISIKIKNILNTGINDKSGKIDLSYIINSKVSFKFGANSIYHTFIPNDEDYSQTITNQDDINVKHSSSVFAFENAVYLENELNLKWFNTNVGARFTSYNLGNQVYYSPEPRLLLNFILREDLSLKYSFSEMNQYVHLLSYSGAGLPSDYWMPTTENVKPEKSLQNTLGVFKTFKNGEYEVSLEAYHKTINNLISFKSGKSLLGNLDDWEKVIDKNGKGINYGIELFLEKIKGNTTGWIGATISKAQRQFENINNGETFPFKYDRLIDISFAANQKIKKNITISATWVYGTGYPVTLASERYTIEGNDVFVYDKINSYKMRDYHRLDVAINFPKKTKWGERTWSISIINIYNRKNPYYYYYDRDFSSEMVNTGNGYTFTGEYSGLKIYQRSLFGILPTFSFNFKFI